MKNLKYIMGCAAMFAAGFAYSETWTLDPSKLGTTSVEVDLSNTYGDAETDGYWKNSSSVSMRGQGFADGDNVIINNSRSGDLRLTLNIDQPSTTLGAFTAGGASWTFVVGKSGSNVLTLDSLTSTGLLQLYKFDLHVKGDVNTSNQSLALGRGNNSERANYRIRIDGNITGGNSVFIMANGLIKSRAPADNTFANGMANPDTIISGIIDNTNVLMMADPNYDSYVQVGGIKGSGLISRESKWNTSTNKNTYVILKNAADYSAAGYVNDWEPNAYTYQASMGKTSFTMNGTASQEFTSNSLAFMGGVKAMSGTIKMNFKQNADFYWYYSDNAKTQTVKFYSDSAAGKRTTFSHGDLEMLGGTFASSNDSASYGSFRFTNIKYSSGTIKLRLDSADKIDSIDISSYYSQTNSEAAVLVAGGTLSREEGAGKIAFDFGENLAWLTKLEESSDGVKVIAWDSKSSLVAEDFIANIFTDGDGEKYTAQFAVNDDGLYVKYVAVPEPAEVAAIFGALVLALAAYRRRK